MKLLGLNLLIYAVNEDTANHNIAIKHGAKLYTLDADFSRFKGLRWERPF